MSISRSVLALITGFGLALSACAGESSEDVGSASAPVRAKAVNGIDPNIVVPQLGNIYDALVQNGETLADRKSPGYVNEVLNTPQYGFFGGDPTIVKNLVEAAVPRDYSITIGDNEFFGGGLMDPINIATQAVTPGTDEVSFLGTMIRTLHNATSNAGTKIALLHEAYGTSDDNIDDYVIPEGIMWSEPSANGRGWDTYFIVNKADLQAADQCPNWLKYFNARWCHDLSKMDCQMTLLPAPGDSRSMDDIIADHCTSRSGAMTTFGARDPDWYCKSDPNDPNMYPGVEIRVMEGSYRTADVCYTK